MKAIVITMICAFSAGLTYGQKTVYTANYYFDKAKRFSYIVSFGPDKKLKKDYDDPEKPTWDVFNYSTAIDFFVYTNLKKQYYEHHPIEKIISNDPPKEEGDTVVLGYKCRKVTVVVSQANPGGKFKSKYTYYLTKELAYPSSYGTVNLINDFIPVAGIEGFLVKGSYEVISIKSKMAKDMAKYFYYNDFKFDKTDDRIFNVQ